MCPNSSQYTRFQLFKIDEVADASRTEKTICLAVSPSLKAHGISGRARLFEVAQKVKEVNQLRMVTAIGQKKVRKSKDGCYVFSSSSFDANALAADPSLELSCIVAPPRMRLYMDYSTRIYHVYLKYVSPDDIHVYSIDEVFIDVTHYLSLYKMSARELAMTMIRDILYTTGITATGGIGTNLYLAKVAMDIVGRNSFHIHHLGFAASGSTDKKEKPLCRVITRAVGMIPRLLH